MNIDVNELCMIQLFGYRDYFERLGLTVHIYVHATKQFLHDNPQMTDHVKDNPNGPMGHGYVIFNISTVATKNQHREDNYFVFNARFKGKDYVLRIILGDIFGLGPAGAELLLIDPGAIVLSPVHGSLLLRPYESVHAEVSAPVPQPETKPQRPKLTVVKN